MSHRRHHQTTLPLVLLLALHHLAIRVTFILRRRQPRPHHRSLRYKTMMALAAVQSLEAVWLQFVAAGYWTRAALRGHLHTSARQAFVLIIISIVELNYLFEESGNSLLPTYCIINQSVKANLPNRWATHCNDDTKHTQISPRVIEQPTPLRPRSKHVEQRDHAHFSDGKACSSSDPKRKTRAASLAAGMPDF